MADAKMLGLDKLKARLARVGKAMRDAAAAQLKTEAEELAAAIRRAAPVRSGALKSSIGAKPGKRDLSYIIYAGGQATTKKVRSRAANEGRGKTKGVSDADFAKALVTGGNSGEFDYSRADEFGRRTHAGVHVPGKPFFFVTYRARKRAMRSRMIAAPKKAAKTAFEE